MTERVRAGVFFLFICLDFCFLFFVCFGVTAPNRLRSSNCAGCSVGRISPNTFLLHIRTRMSTQLCEDTNKQRTEREREGGGAYIALWLVPFGTQRAQRHTHRERGERSENRESREKSARAHTRTYHTRTTPSQTIYTSYHHAHITHTHTHTHTHR